MWAHNPPAPTLLLRPARDPSLPPPRFCLPWDDLPARSLPNPRLAQLYGMPSEGGQGGTFNTCSLRISYSFSSRNPFSSSMSNRSRLVPGPRALMRDAYQSKPDDETPHIVGPFAASKEQVVNVSRFIRGICKGC